MSAGKFASITASILARKGEAKPWQDPDEDLHWHDNPQKQEFSMRPSEVTNLVQPPRARQAPNSIGAATLLKKCSMRMSFQEYEQLGILAVKRDCSRQQLLREALAQFFTALAKDYRNVCPCMEHCHDNSCGNAAEL